MASSFVPPCSCLSILLINANIYFFYFFCPEGVVPESEVQREAHEAAEHSERPETRVLPRPEADESAGGEAGGGGARPLLLLWR